MNSSFLRQPELPSDAFLRALRARLPHEAVERAVMPSGVEVIGVSVARGKVFAVWDEWRKRHGETGWWPYVTLQSPDDLARSRRQEDVDEVVERWVAEVACQDHDARAASVVLSSFRWSMDCAAGDEEDQEGWRDDYDPDRLAPQLAPARAEPLPGVSRWGTGDRDSFWGQSQRWINFVPVRGGYEVPAVLPHLYGTCNWFGYDGRVLTPADDAALLRRWHEQWGAELFLAQGPYLELVVDRPPLDPRDAARATSELQGYCSDTVQRPQHDGDTWLRSTVWSLWWD
ncbi:DUF4253 domain-containing protein [Streptomyces sp. NPDC020422]|uniref:DUF4253 domain-containing protein n=1 Tax=Streptomyces sp. NPDC020422 TaxID=3365074 RepID=UPI0037B5017F